MQVPIVTPQLLVELIPYETTTRECSSKRCKGRHLHYSSSDPMSVCQQAKAPANACDCNYTQQLLSDMVLQLLWLIGTLMLILEEDSTGIGPCKSDTALGLQCTSRTVTSSSP